MFLFILYGFIFSAVHALYFHHDANIIVNGHKYAELVKYMKWNMNVYIYRIKDDEENICTEECIGDHSQFSPQHS